MSALPPKADTLTGDIDVRLVPQAGIAPHPNRFVHPEGFLYMRLKRDAF
jgi:hypothetical protein